MVGDVAPPACRSVANGFLCAGPSADGGIFGGSRDRILRANVLSMAAGTVGDWWTTRLSVFWRSQILGWRLFGLVDVLNRLLIYRSIAAALALTLVVTPCLALLSTGMHSIYASRRVDN